MKPFNKVLLVNKSKIDKIEISNAEVGIKNTSKDISKDIKNFIENLKKFNVYQEDGNNYTKIGDKEPSDFKYILLYKNDGSIYYKNVSDKDLETYNNFKTNGIYFHNEKFYILIDNDRSGNVIKDFTKIYNVSKDNNITKIIYEKEYPATDGYINYLMDYNNIDIEKGGFTHVVVGMGPVGLMTGLTILSNIPNSKVLFFENRYEFIERQYSVVINEIIISLLLNILEKDDFLSVLGEGCAVISPRISKNGKCFYYRKDKFKDDFFKEYEITEPAGVKYITTDNIFKYEYTKNKINNFLFNNKHGDVPKGIIMGINQLQERVLELVKKYGDRICFKFKKMDLNDLKKLTSQIYIDCSGGRSVLTDIYDVNILKEYSKNPDENKNFYPPAQLNQGYGLVIFLKNINNDNLLYNSGGDESKNIFNNNTPVTDQQDRYRLFVKFDEEKKIDGPVYLGVQISDGEFLNHTADFKLTVKDPFKNFKENYILDIVKHGMNYYGIKSSHGGDNFLLDDIIKIIMFPIGIFDRRHDTEIDRSISNRKFGFITHKINEKEKNILLVGDSKSHVNFFSGTGVNNGVNLIYNLFYKSSFNENSDTSIQITGDPRNVNKFKSGGVLLNGINIDDDKKLIREECKESDTSDDIKNRFISSYNVSINYQPIIIDSDELNDRFEESKKKVYSKIDRQTKLKNDIKQNLENISRLSEYPSSTQLDTFIQKKHICDLTEYAEVNSLSNETDKINIWNNKKFIPSHLGIRLAHMLTYGSFMNTLLTNTDFKVSFEQKLVATLLLCNKAIEMTYIINKTDDNYTRDNNLRNDIIIYDRIKKIKYICINNHIILYSEDKSTFYKIKKTFFKGDSKDSGILKYIEDKKLGKIYIDPDVVKYLKDDSNVSSFIDSANKNFIISGNNNQNIILKQDTSRCGNELLYKNIKGDKNKYEIKDNDPNWEYTLIAMALYNANHYGLAEFINIKTIMDYEEKIFENIDNFDYSRLSEAR